MTLAVFDILAGIASIAGAILSYVAWQRAAAAEKAAAEAREAVRHGNAGEDLRRLNEQAQGLLADAQNDLYEAALLRSRGLLSGIAEATERWDAFLLEGDSKAKLAKASKQIGRISRALSAGKDAITPPIREKLLESCHEVCEALAKEAGKMLSRIQAKE